LDIEAGRVVEFDIEDFKARAWERMKKRQRKESA